MCEETFPPLNIPTASENITFLIILPFQDPRNLIFLDEMEQGREFSTIGINFEHSFEIYKKIYLLFWEYFNNGTKLAPLAYEPEREIRIEILIKINKS